jgi:hypothetical protein
MAPGRLILALPDGSEQIYEMGKNSITLGSYDQRHYFV